MKKKIFIACDTNDLKIVRKVLKYTRTKELDIGYKFGLEFFYSKYGRAFIAKLKKDISVWADLKAMDIPNTVASAINSLKDLKNIKYITIHASGGYEMMRAAKKASTKINKKIKILAVTVLTSFSEKTLKKTGHTKSIKKLVVEQTRLAMKANLDGIICSAHEVRLIRKICKRKIIITPGIRLKGDSTQDQARIMTPKKAFENKSDAIVIGRSITKGDIKNNIKRLINSLK